MKKTYYLPSSRNIISKAPLGSFFALLRRFTGAISSMRGGSLKHWFASNEGWVRGKCLKKWKYELHSFILRVAWYLWSDLSKNCRGNGEVQVKYLEEDN